MFGYHRIISPGAVNAYFRFSMFSATEGSIVPSGRVSNTRHALYRPCDPFTHLHILWYHGCRGLRFCRQGTPRVVPVNAIMNGMYRGKGA